jgi:hypothetical protein
MKNQLVLIGIVAILVIVGLSRCNQVSNTLKSEKDKFFGTWQNHTSWSYSNITYDMDTTFIFFQTEKQLFK